VCTLLYMYSNFACYDWQEMGTWPVYLYLLYGTECLSYEGGINYLFTGSQICNHYRISSGKSYYIPRENKFYTKCQINYGFSTLSLLTVINNTVNIDKLLETRLDWNYRNEKSTFKSTIKYVHKFRVRIRIVFRKLLYLHLFYYC